jgi:hypothetical protein
MKSITIFKGVLRPVAGRACERRRLFADQGAEFEFFRNFDSRKRITVVTWPVPLSQ